MDWNLIIAIAAMVTGGGCVIWIFNAGQWKGEMSTKMENFRNDLDSQRETLIGKVQSQIGHTTQSLGTVVVEEVGDAITKLRTEFRADIIRVHERLDNDTSVQNTQQVQARLDALIAGIKDQRQEWDTLRSDVRALLRAEATTTTEITNFKERLVNFENKIGILSEKTTRLESDVAHIAPDRRK